MKIAERILKLQQETNSITFNPLLNCFEQQECKLIDDLSETDTFIKEKQQKILSFIDNLGIDFSSKLNNAFNEYNEAIIYLTLKQKFGIIERIREGNGKSPDFKITVKESDQPIDYYIELKTLAFADGDLNYKKAIERGIDAQISIEKQINDGKKVAFGEIIVQPLYKHSKKYDIYSVKYVIETYIEKIEQNLKSGQFDRGNTILFVDLKQTGICSDIKEASVPFFKESQLSSIVSGVLWNVAFGKIGHLILKPIEFEGKENIDGDLTKNGILQEYEWIKALCFITYENFKTRKFVGFHRVQDENVQYVLAKLCTFYNDELNSNGYELHEKA